MVSFKFSFLIFSCSSGSSSLSSIDEFCGYIAQQSGVVKMRLQRDKRGEISEMFYCPSGDLETHGTKRWTPQNWGSQWISWRRLTRDRPTWSGAVRLSKAFSSVCPSSRDDPSESEGRSCLSRGEDIQSICPELQIGPECIPKECISNYTTEQSANLPGAAIKILENTTWLIARLAATCELPTFSPFLSTSWMPSISSLMRCK